MAESYPWYVSIRKNDNSTKKSAEEKQKLGEDYKLEKLISSGIGRRSTKADRESMTD